MAAPARGSCGNSAAGGGGCGLGGSPDDPAELKSYDAPPRTAITVITNTDLVAQARQQAEAREEQFKRVALEGIGGDSFFWAQYELMSRYRQRPERITPELRQIGLGKGDDLAARATACVLLCRLGDAEGWRGLESLLRAGATARKAALARLRTLEMERPFRLATEDDLDGLAGSVMEALTSQDPGTRDAAADVCATLELQEAVPRLRDLLRSDRVKDKGEILDALTQLAPDEELCRLTAKELSRPEEQVPYQACYALYRMSQHPDGAVSRCAVRAFADLVARRLPSGCELAATVLAERGTADELPVLRSLLEKPEADEALLLGGLARLGDADSRARLIQLLGDPAARHRALAGARIAASGSEGQEIVERLASGIPETGSVPHGLMQTLLAIGGPAAEARARALAPGLHHEDRVELLWHLDRRTAGAAAERFRQLGIIPEVPNLDTARRLASWLDDPDERRVFSSVLDLAGVAHSFDTETGAIPCRHDLLILDLAAASGGVFEPDTVLERWEPKDEDDSDTPYGIELVFRDRLYRFEAENLGDWYDLNAVLDGMNRALEEAALAHRYVPLHTGDQTATILFGDPQALQKAASEGWIVLSMDADASRRSGKAFEDEVLRELGVQEGSPR